MDIGYDPFEKGYCREEGQLYGVLEIGRHKPMGEELSEVVLDELGVSGKQHVYLPDILRGWRDRLGKGGPKMSVPVVAGIIVQLRNLVYSHFQISSSSFNGTRSSSRSHRSQGRRWSCYSFSVQCPHTEDTTRGQILQNLPTPAPSS